MDGLTKEVAEVRAAAKKLRGIALLTGTEMDIRADGTLDLPDAALAKLDFVTASVHSAFRQDKEKMTQRIIKAMENPNVDCIGHLTGRLLGRREGYAVDVEAVLKAAARNGTAIELNANPLRLDLTDQALPPRQGTGRPGRHQHRRAQRRGPATDALRRRYRAARVAREIQRPQRARHAAERKRREVTMDDGR